MNQFGKFILIPTISTQKSMKLARWRLAFIQHGSHSFGQQANVELLLYFFLSPSFFPAVRPAPALNLKKMMSPSSTM